MRKAKIVSLFSFLLVLSLLVAACSGPETAEPPAAQEDAPAVEAPPAESEPNRKAKPPKKANRKAKLLKKARATWLPIPTSTVMGRSPATK
jgi:hypothetical protein